MQKHLVDVDIRYSLAERYDDLWCVGCQAGIIERLPPAAWQLPSPASATPSFFTAWGIYRFLPSTFSNSSFFVILQDHSIHTPTNLPLPVVIRTRAVFRLRSPPSFSSLSIIHATVSLTMLVFWREWTDPFVFCFSRKQQLCKLFSAFPTIYLPWAAFLLITSVPQLTSFFQQKNHHVSRTHPSY